MNLKIWLLYVPIFLVSSSQNVTGATKWYNCIDLGNSCTDNISIVFIGLFKRSPYTNIWSRSETFHTKKSFQHFNISHTRNYKHTLTTAQCDQTLVYFGPGLLSISTIIFKSICHCCNFRRTNIETQVNNTTFWKDNKSSTALLLLGYKIHSFRFPFNAGV